MTGPPTSPPSAGAVRLRLLLGLFALVAGIAAALVAILLVRGAI